MTKEQNRTSKTCFFVTPIGEQNSKEFKKMSALLDNVINPTIEKYEYETVVAHKIQEIGSIGEQVFSAIKEASLVICDLTGLNPNVMYETAVAHSFGKPTIIIVENDGTKLPFDISSDRAIFYEDSIEGTGSLIDELNAKISHIEETSLFDNPVLRVMKQAATLKEIDGKEDVQSQIYRMLIEIQGRLPQRKEPQGSSSLSDIRVLLTLNSEEEPKEINKLLRSAFLNTGYDIKSVKYKVDTFKVVIFLFISDNNPYDLLETKYHREKITDLIENAFPDTKFNISFRR